MNKKHAYLIMAHNEFDVLVHLLRCLDFDMNDIYIHIDKKVSDFQPEFFESIIRNSNVFFVKDRVDVKWGDFSQIECELKLLREASKKHYRYYHLLSGVDMPLKSQQEIYGFFEENYGLEFIHFESSVLSKNEEYKVKKYHLICSKNKTLLQKIFYRFMMMIEFPVDRTRKSDTVFLKGANWFSITDSLVNYIMLNEEWIRKTFEHTLCGDEFFIQTLAYNSQFRGKISSENFRDNYGSILYCIDWKRGNPYVFTNDDYDYLVNSGMLFARKFSWEKDRKIVQKLTRDCTERGNNS